MASLTHFFETDFNTQREQWEKALLSELKISEPGAKGQKSMSDGSLWPTLSLEATQEVHLSSSPWKKASNSYGHIDPLLFLKDFSDDLESGVRNFFFYRKTLTPSIWTMIEETLKNFSKKEEIEVFVLDGGYESSHFKVINQMISGKDFHDQGGHSIHELALLGKNLIQSLSAVTEDIFLGVYVDSRFFQNIAKIRAAKLIAQKILLEENRTENIHVVALTSFEGWTLYECYSNMLRNQTAVASAYIGGADHIQSSGYYSLLEFESDSPLDKDHLVRSQRMARNTSHVLALESMLGVVEDAAFGSYHLENLTEYLCEESWKLMQELMKGTDISTDLVKTREKKLHSLNTRKTILSGTNDFPDVKEKLGLILKAPSSFRLSRGFEELRLKMEAASQPPSVRVLLFGDYSALNARANFVKNYFELLGLHVEETHYDLENLKLDLSNIKEEIIVLCSLDEHYSKLELVASTNKKPHAYIAGKVQLPGFINLYAGQNVFEVLEKIVKDYSSEAK